MHLPFNSTTRSLVNKSYYKAQNLEKEIGYKLDFGKFPKGWINGQMLFNMSSVWKRAKIPAKGVSRFTIGAIENGKSTRFDNNSPYYQAWFGGYIVKFAKSRSWSIQDHFRLTLADQKTWLSVYGDPKPFAKVDSKNIKRAKKIKIGKFEGQLSEGSILSHSDVGIGKKPALFPLYMDGLAQTFNKSNPKLKIKPAQLTPPKQIEKSFQPIILHGYIAIVEMDRFTKAVIYANGTIFQDARGKKQNTFKKLESEFLKMIKNIKLIKKNK